MGVYHLSLQSLGVGLSVAAFALRMLILRKGTLYARSGWNAGRNFVVSPRDHHDDRWILSAAQFDCDPRTLGVGSGFVFYDSRSKIGWVLAIGSLVALIFGVIASVNFSFRSMSAFDLIVILVLAFGGVGLVLKSLTPPHSRTD